MVSELTVSEARADLGPVTSRAEYGGETTYLTKHGHRAAAAVAALKTGAEQRVPFVRRTRRRTG